MRLLRVHIDVTNGTATPAQPDPQTVHLNAAQSQQQKKKLPLQATDPPLASNHWGKIHHREPLSRQKEPLILPLTSHSNRKYRCLGTGVQLFLPRRFLLQPPLETYQVLPDRLPHPALPTLTLLVALGCCKRQISHPRQRALSIDRRGRPLLP